jgi:hypothetical protein
MQWQCAKTITHSTERGRGKKKQRLDKHQFLSSTVGGFVHVGAGAWQQCSLHIKGGKDGVRASGEGGPGFAHWRREAPTLAAPQRLHLGHHPIGTRARQ